MFDALFNMIPWGSIIMEGINGLCEIVDGFFGHNSSRSNNNRYNNYYSEPVRVQPQMQMNYGYNNYYPQQHNVVYNDEGKVCVPGVIFM